MTLFFDLDIVLCAMTYNSVTGWTYRYKDGYDANNVLHTGPYMPLTSLMDELVTLDGFRAISSVPAVVGYVVRQSTGGAGWDYRVATVADGKLRPAQHSLKDWQEDRTGSLVFCVQLFQDTSIVWKVGR